ncbi:hypothetical protein [Ralstonia insidiosa]|jgi:hypothetical protein|nr:hypothetical protein [Ralstonia insidiosa]MBA9939883.1 hypothetical protein [Ralstonia insidiosa]MBC9968545.1 hypothetical protein [Ralstonia insidiosa]MBX3904634.1 hypothetical protein [Ralstonia insidiosa]
MQLYIDGHNHKKGYAVSVAFSDEEIRALPVPIEVQQPVRFYSNLRYARRMIQRFNRLAQRVK